jgi:hypothetical protein
MLFDGEIVVPDVEGRMDERGVVGEEESDVLNKTGIRGAVGEEDVGDRDRRRSWTGEEEGRGVGD